MVPALCPPLKAFFDIWGLYSSITSFVIPLAYILGGSLAQRIPMVLIFGATGVLLLLVDLWVVNLKEVRELGR